MWWLGWLGHIPNLPHPYSFCLLEPSHLVSCFCLYLYLYPKLYSLKFMACHQSLALIRRHILLLIITVTLEISQPGLYTTEHCSPQNVIVPKNNSLVVLRVAEHRQLVLGSLDSEVLKVNGISGSIQGSSAESCEALGTLSRRMFWTVPSRETLQCCKNYGKASLVRP